MGMALCYDSWQKLFRESLSASIKNYHVIGQKKRIGNSPSYWSIIGISERSFILSV